MADKKKLFLLVSYFNEKEVAEFVTSQLNNLLNDTIHAVIIDNGSFEPEILEKLCNSNLSLTLCKPENNIGYFGAAHYGLNHYLKINNLPDLIIICNTDISFEGISFIKQLDKIYDEKKFDVLGPDIYSTFLKYHQNPYIAKRISRQKMQIYKWVTSSQYLYTIFTLLHLIKTTVVKSNQNKITNEIDTYAIHGSFMIFNKTYFTKGGSINYPSLLFGEEIFVAETALQRGLKVIYEPSLHIEHRQNATTNSFKSKKLVQLMNQSYRYLLKTFFIK